MLNFPFVLLIALIGVLLTSTGAMCFAQLSNTTHIILPNSTSSNTTFNNLNTTEAIPNQNTEAINHSYYEDAKAFEPNAGQNLTKLYNSTINSIVQITSFDNQNSSNYKTGTGFIVDVNKTLSLITSNSLVSSNDSVTMTLDDGDIYDSSLIGSDPVTNIALLSIENIPQDKINSLELMNSTNLQVGETVTKIENIQDIPNLLNTGIISGISKSIPTFGQNVSNTSTKIPNGIITNLVSTSEGYGGGPLLNIEGQVLGMTIQNHSSEAEIVSPITFVIPSNSLNKIIPKLQSQGYYLHPWLGIAGTDVTPDIAKVLELDQTRGFLVISVSPQSPAKLAGILGGDSSTSINGRPITLGGDIILKIDNKDVKNIHEILSYIEDNKNVGDNLIVTVLRNGILQTINVVLEANPNYIPSSK